MSGRISNKLVTDGLILSLDAGNVKSFISGTTWSDMSPSKFNCTLINNPTFNPSNGGSIQFTSAGSYGDMGQILNFTTENFTFSFWVFITSLSTNVGGQGPIPFYKGSYNINGYYCQINSDGSLFLGTNEPSFKFSSTGAGEFAVGTWYNVVITKNGSSVRLYKNGIDKTTTIATHGTITSSPNNFTLSLYTGGSIYSNLRIAKFNVYNRPLNANEVLSNFNTHKNIYGL